MLRIGIRSDGRPGFPRRAGRQALAIAVAAGLLSACSAATPGSRSAGAGKAPTAGPGTAAGAHSSRLGVEALDSFIPATGAEFTVGARFVGTMTALESRISAACMAKSGFHVPVTSASAAAAQFFDNSEFPDLATISRTKMFGPDVTAAGSPRLPPTEQRRYQADLARCRAAGQQPFTGLLHASSGIGNSWFDIVASVQSSAQVRAAVAGFRSCVEAAGTPASSVAAAGTPASSAGALDAFLAWVTGLETSADTNEGRIAVDRHWSPVFVRCARAPVALQERLQSARRATFLKEHAQQARALQALAGSVVAQVQRQIRAAGSG